MPRIARSAALLVLFAAAGPSHRPAGAAPVPKDHPAARDPGPNSNAVVKRYQAGLKFGCSTSWQGGWPADRAFDGNPTTSWFTASGDCVATGKTPWVSATFPADVAVGRVTVLGNREAQWPTGFSAAAGRLELLDKDGRVVIRVERPAKGPQFDLDFVLCEAFGGVRTVRFTVTQDQSDAAQPGTHSVGVGDILVE